MVAADTAGKQLHVVWFEIDAVLPEGMRVRARQGRVVVVGIIIWRRHEMNLKLVSYTASGIEDHRHRYLSQKIVAQSRVVLQRNSLP